MPTLQTQRVMPRWSLPPEKARPWLLMALLIVISNVQVSARPYLIFANRADIRVWEVKKDKQTTNPGLVVKNLNSASALDFFLAKNKICWTEISESRLPQGAIKCTQVKKGNSTRDLIVDTGLVKPEGLACDWINNKIYWTDSEMDRIEVTSLDPEQPLRRVLFWENLELPRAIAVAPHDGLMFWSDWGANHPKIERASMDGNPDSRVVIVDQNIKWPNGITLDYDNKMLYWVDAKHRYIARVNWNGGERVEIYSQKSALQQPFAITIHLTELYWTDWNTNSLNMYNFSVESNATVENADGTINYQPERIKFKKDLTPMDIKVYEPMRQKPGLSGCSQNNGGCSHLCLAASNSFGYSCVCPTGIKLLNNKTCASSASQLLLLAKGNELLSISLDTQDFTETFIPFDWESSFEEEPNTMAIDYDPIENSIYWTDQELGIFSSFLNGSNLRNIVYDNIKAPDGIAVDWIGRNLFWVNSHDNLIEVSKLDGTSRKILISADLDEPRDVAIDPLKGFIFWSDWGLQAKIERAWMDGTNRKTIVSENIVWPNGIALDISSDLRQPQRLYWCDAKLDTIEMVNLDGSDRRVIINSMIQHPFGLSVLGNYIYWTDWERQTIERAPKNTKSSGEDIHVLLKDKKSLMSIQTVNTQPDPSWTNPCMHNNGGCSNLCLFTPSRGPFCHCPIGYEIAKINDTTCTKAETFLVYARQSDIGILSLKPFRQNLNILPIKRNLVVSSIDFDYTTSQIFWSDSELKTISRSSVNGTHREVILEFGIEFPDSISFDWISRNIYWVDSGMNRIEVAREDGSSRRVIVWKNLTNPKNIVVNPLSGFIYWSANKDGNIIEKAASDGTGKSIFVSGIGKPVGLSLDFETKRLYWINGDTLSIEYLSLDSTSVKSPFSVVKLSKLSSNQPIALFLYKNYVFWADADNGTVQRVNKENGLDHLTIQSDLEDMSDIVVYHNPPRNYANPCSIKNGGCSDLCLFVKGRAKCACPSHYKLTTSNNIITCQEPEDFLLFSQRNKISRLMFSEDEVPDVILPVYGAKDIQSLTYDPLERMVYWVDLGTAKKKEKKLVSIRRSAENGSFSEKVFEGSVYRPHSLGIDPVTRLLFWSCKDTNTINITRLDDDEPIGSITFGIADKPRFIALHPYKSLIFWTNHLSSVVIERSLIDGNDRKLIIASELEDVESLVVDHKDDLLFWADSKLKKIESSDLNGENRKIIISNYKGSTMIAVNGMDLYWTDTENHIILKTNKMTGQGTAEVKSQAQHLTGLLAVLPKPDINHPCASLNCSHVCLAEPSKNQARCSCPKGTGMVLSPDKETCGYPPTCKPSEFTCTSGSPACLPLQWRCDGQSECSDHSDEIGCPECEAKHFKCRNGGCVNASAICDGVKDCLDESDESNCCPKEKFLCISNKQCIDQNMTCDGELSCSDSPDGSSSRCTAGEDLDSPFSENNNTTIQIVVGLVVILVLFALVAFYFCYCFKKTRGENKNSIRQPDHDNTTIRKYQANLPVGSEPKQHLQAIGGIGNSNNNSPLPDNDGLSGAGLSAHGIGGSSNGLAYDRSHVTGASSSTTSSSNYPRDIHNPPPSPATVIANRRSNHNLGPRQHQSMHSLPRQSKGKNRFGGRQNQSRSSQYHRPPPPTPYSTDFYEESDGYAGGPSFPHFTSAANSVVGGYESSEVYVDHLPHHKPHPPSLNHYESETSIPPSPTPEDDFLNQPDHPGPPPSPALPMMHLEEDGD